MSARSMAGAFLAMVPLSLALACSDKTPAPGPSATEVPLEVSMSEAGPPAYVTDDLDISERELLRRSDAAMREIDYLRVFTTEEPQEDAEGFWFNLAESGPRFSLQTLADFQLSRVGGEPTWMNSDFLPQPGESRRSGPALSIFDRAGEAFEFESLIPGVTRIPTEVRLVGEDVIDGRGAWVLWYHFTLFGIEGPITTWFTEWIDQSTLLLLRQESNNDDGFGYKPGLIRILMDFNQPDAELNVPIDLPTARLQRFTETLTVTATADSYVQQDWPDGSFGADAELRTDGSPWRRTLVRFEVDGLPRDAEVRSVRVGIFGTARTFEAIHPEGSATHIRAVHLAEGAWLERSLTWSNAPRLGRELGELGNTQGFPDPRREAYESVWFSADVTDAVPSNGEYSFYVISEHGIAGNVFSSREGEHPPVLVVTYEYTDEPPIPLPTP